MLWLDISRRDSKVDVLKRCTDIENGVAIWEDVTVSTEDLKYIDQTLQNVSSEVVQLRNEILSRVTQEEFSNGLATTEETIMQQLPSKVSIQVTEAKQAIDKQLAPLVESVDNLDRTVGKYFDFTTEGLVIGDKGNIGNNFRVKLDNRKLSFM